MSYHRLLIDLPSRYFAPRGPHSSRFVAVAEMEKGNSARFMGAGCAAITDKGVSVLQVNSQPMLAWTMAERKSTRDQPARPASSVWGRARVHRSLARMSGIVHGVVDPRADLARASPTPPNSTATPRNLSPLRPGRQGALAPPFHALR